MESLLIGCVVGHGAVAMQETSALLDSFDAGVRAVVLGNYNAAVFQATAALLLFNACTGRLPSMVCFVVALVLFSRSLVLGAHAIGDADSRKTSTHAIAQLLVSIFFLRTIFMAFYSEDRRRELLARSSSSWFRPQLAALAGLLLVFLNMFIRASIVSGAPEHRKRGWRWTMVGLATLSVGLLIAAAVSLWRGGQRAVSLLLCAAAATTLQLGFYELQRIRSVHVHERLRSGLNIAVAVAGVVSACAAYIRWSRVDAKRLAPTLRRYELPIPVAARVGQSTLDNVGEMLGGK